MKNTVKDILMGKEFQENEAFHKEALRHADVFTKAIKQGMNAQVSSVILLSWGDTYERIRSFLIEGIPAIGLEDEKELSQEFEKLAYEKLCGTMKQVTDYAEECTDKAARNKMSGGNILTQEIEQKFDQLYDDLVAYYTWLTHVVVPTKENEEIRIKLFGDGKMKEDEDCAESERLLMRTLVSAAKMGADADSIIEIGNIWQNTYDSIRATDASFLEESVQDALPDEKEKMINSFLVDLHYRMESLSDDIREDMLDRVREAMKDENTDEDIAEEEDSLTASIEDRHNYAMNKLNEDLERTVDYYNYEKDKTRLEKHFGECSADIYKTKAPFAKDFLDDYVKREVRLMRAFEASVENDADETQLREIMTSFRNGFMVIQNRFQYGRDYRSVENITYSWECSLRSKWCTAMDNVVEETECMIIKIEEGSMDGGDALTKKIQKTFEQETKGFKKASGQTDDIYQARIDRVHIRDAKSAGHMAESLLSKGVHILEGGAATYWDFGMHPGFKSFVGVYDAEKILKEAQSYMADARYALREVPSLESLADDLYDYSFGVSLTNSGKSTESAARQALAVVSHVTNTLSHIEEKLTEKIGDDTF